MNIRDFSDHADRRMALEKELDVDLSTVGKVFHDETEKVHCENLIGAVAIPLGVAGPININGEHVQREVFIPLATSEGALVASVSRGAKAITESGGAIVRIEKVGTTRGPVFEVEGIEEALHLKKWIQDHENKLRQIAESTSTHLLLKQIEISILGRYVYMRFIFDTDEAMGMNMVTIASEEMASYISENTQATCIAVAGNFDIDKKPAYLNFISGRGRKGWAEVSITSEILQNVLKTNAQKVQKVVEAKCWGGSIMSGSLGYNAHFANITAAFFAATGQDLAHVVEGSLGVTSAKILEDGSLYFSIYMPDIMLGSVGGGTKLKTQTEARSIMNIQSADELSEIFVGAVLAGELSLIASLAEGSLSSAHRKLGR